MNSRNLFIIISIILLTGCKQINSNNEVDLNSQIKYKNTGFALIYSEDLKNKKEITKKLDNRAILIFHKNLKKKFFCKNYKPHQYENNNS